MTTKRKQYSAQEKAKIALEAIKENHTIAQLTSKYGVHSSQIHAWKKLLLNTLPQAFSDKRQKENRDQDRLIEDLYKQIGQLKVENEWLKKKFDLVIR